MKLYSYVLEENYRTKEIEIVSAECEVIEKPKTYKAVDRFIAGTYTSSIRKEDIGRIIGYSNNRIVLTEPDLERVKQIFSEQIESGIKSTKETLDALEKKLSAVRSFVG